MRRLLVFLGLLTASLGLVGQNSNDSRFPLMAWDYVDNPTILQSMHEAGITAVAFVPVRMLDSCERLQMDCIVVDERLSGQPRSKPFDGDQFRENLPTVVKEVGKHHSPYGYHVKDEPSEADFPGLAKAVAAVKNIAPGKWPSTCSPAKAHRTMLT